MCPMECRGDMPISQIRGQCSGNSVGLRQCICRVCLSHGFNGRNGFISKTNSLSALLSLSGHYVYVDTSFAKQGEKAVLLSSDLQAEEWSCLRLVYQITAPLGPVSQPSQLNLYVRFEDESFDHLLWSTKEPSDSWLIASLDLPNSPKKFKVGRAEEEDRRPVTCFMFHEVL